MALAKTESFNVSSELQKFSKRQVVRDFLCPISHIDGRCGYLKISGVPQYAVDGGFLGYRGIGIDYSSQVTETQRANQSNEWLEDAIESIVDGCALFDAEDQLIFCNDKYKAAFPEVANLLAPGITFRTVIERIAQAGKILGSVGREEQWVKDRMAKHRTYQGPIEHRYCDGLWIQITEYRTREGGTLIVRNDITQRKRTEEHLLKLFRAVEQSPVSVVITNLQGDIEYVNPKFVEVTGYSAEEVIGQNSRLLKSGDKPSREYQELWETIKSGKEWRGEFLNRKKDGTLYWEFASISPVKTVDDKITHYLAVKEDITLRKEYETRLLHMANFDEITHLPNRALAMDRLSAALARARRHNCKVGLLFIDLDQFKKVNDTLGHAAGDLLLNQAGQRFRNCLREDDTVARLGGDEFAIILPEIEDALDAEPVAARILEAFSHHFVVDGHEVYTTTSIGIAVFPDHSHHVDTLMRDADTAMYLAKSKGRNTFRYFTTELNDKARQLMRMESHLRRALELGELTLHYQPIVAIDTGKLDGMEALLRWHNTELGDVSPERFIKLAEDTGLIATIGAWVLNTACRQANQWHVQLQKPLNIAVNVSSRQFHDTTLLRTVLGTLSESGLKPQYLELEITEGLLMDDLSQTTSTLYELAKLGVHLAVDDFGTGYSSLSYLRRFRVDKLKIDKSFIQGMTTDANNAVLVKTVVALGHSLGLRVVAEGVETQAQLAQLKEYNCDLAQGYYFSPPVPGDVLTKRLQEWL
ncbi:MAG: EAL domain-containing protein [Gammaproteobacteria bacterium]|nr:EAL domain-containing protein [Gammaproteobacteria bacterium]